MFSNVVDCEVICCEATSFHHRRSVAGDKWQKVTKFPVNSISTSKDIEGRTLTENVFFCALFPPKTRVAVLFVICTGSKLKVALAEVRSIGLVVAVFQKRIV